MTITIVQSSYEPIPTGRYAAKIVSIEETDGQFGKQLKFSFELPPNEKGESKCLTGWASKKFSPKAKLYEWTTAVLFGGAAIPLEYNFSSDDLLNRKAILVVVEKQGEKGVYNSIESVFPFTQPAQQLGESVVPSTVTQQDSLNQQAKW